MSRFQINLISASAGSGKTYKLTEKLAEALRQGIEPEEILATTFTNKAAAELQERARLSLLNRGEWEKAQRIFDGYVGTVNSVCGRLLQDFAFEAGLSPTLDVLPEGEDQAIYDRAIAPVVEKYAPEIDPVAERLGLDSWRQEVKKISDLARTNNISPASLKASADQSVITFQKLLPQPYTETNGLDGDLWQAISQAVEALNDTTDTTKKTQGVKEQLQKLLRREPQNTGLPWAEWVRLTKLDPGVKSKDIVSPVVEIASLHPRHPRFQQDVQKIILSLFRCAAEAMAAFADFKARHGLIDFVDQESLCLQLLENPEVRATLQEKLKLILVDEFQDTSPVELGIFLKLVEMIGQAVWVGDQKQAIYGFRGTDPALMDAVIESLIDPAHLDILPCSYRSRPGLVSFTNALFAKAFDALGIPPERVTLDPKRQEEKQPNPLHIWWLKAKNNPEEAAALAEAVADLLGRAHEFPVVDKVTRKLRNLRGGDIAILCQTNAKCRKVAEALESRGLRASLPRSGLLAQPESVLALACLRYLVDPRDRLAVAEILHLTADPADPQQWFRLWLANPDSPPKESCSILSTLDENREKLLRLTPSEVLELVLTTAALRDRVVVWGSSNKRLANLEALRGLALAYEDHCRIERSAATPAGLITFLVNRVAGGDKDVQEEGQHEDAVHILTYHRAKGLEWPAVILTDLQAREKASPFGVHVNPSEAAFDVKNPLAGRWIRFWPWPYGNFSQGVGLDDAIEACQEQKWVSLQEKKEMMRLLYVGITRARDYLFLTARENKNSATAWLDSMVDRDGQQLVSLPKEAGAMSLEIAGETFTVQVSSFQPLEGQGQSRQEQVFRYKPASRQKRFPPARISPSQYEDPSITVSIAQKISLGKRLPLVGKPEMACVGEVLHAFLAADEPSTGQEARLVRAKSLLANWQTDGIAPETLLVAGDRLWHFIRERFGADCLYRREWPVHLRMGNQKMSGWLDLLIEKPEGFVIIDHKSFPGPMSKWEEKALGYAPQLYLYRQAVERATHLPVLGTYIHMPIAGVMLEIEAIKNSACSRLA